MDESESALDPARGYEGDGEEQVPVQQPGCVIKQLPERLLVSAATTASRVNPANAPVFGRMMAAAVGGDIIEPMRLAVLTAKYWGPSPRVLTVSFTESAPSNLKQRILSHMNAWNRCGGISFRLVAQGGQVRITRAQSGYWSYLGTDILHIPPNRPTMCLQGFSMSTPESEYKRVVRHETGHTLGFPHEHMRKALIARISPQKAYQWFLSTYGWDKATVDAQVLTPLDEVSLMGTAPDDTSIMAYQLPASIMKPGKPAIPGGTDINATDCAFCGRLYPRAARLPHVASRSAGFADDDGVESEDWDESEDVEVFV
jgi:hypothetical protein